MKRLFPLVFCVLAVPAAAQDAPTKAQYMQVIIDFMAEQNCRYSVANNAGAERAFAQAFEAKFGIPAADILDQDKPYYDVVDDAFDDLRDSGQLMVDRDAGELMLNDCRARN